MKKIVLTLLLLAGCTTKTLRPDFRTSPLDNNYHSAEIIIDGRRFFGVAAAKADLGLPFSFRVGTIHNGYVKVESKACKFSESKSYANSADVEFKIPVLKERCLFSIFVFPQFTADEANKVKWRGISGVLLLRASEHRVFAQAEQLRSGSFYTLDLLLSEETKLFVSGCGFRHSGSHTERVILEIESGTDYDESSCVLDGFARTASGVTDISVLISHYKDLSKLPHPQFKFYGTALGVDADSSVSLLSFQGESRFTSVNTFGVDPSQERILKLYTSQGRFGFCDVQSSWPPTAASGSETSGLWPLSGASEVRCYH